jgi:hypothetical protein
MTLIIEKPTGAKLVMAQVSQPLDADAQAYVNAVEVADRERIEDPVRFAINNFVIGCKADGIWSAIKASCILAGARTLTGVLVPLVGTAPTNVSFVSGDYNRKTGLVGDGSTKYLNSNRNNNADPQNSKHHSVYVSTVATQAGILNGAQVGGATGQSGIAVAGSLENTFRVNNAAATTYSLTSGFLGISRSLSTEVNIRRNSSNATESRTSETPVNEVIGILGRTTNANYSNARLAFYSIGESLDLALLDTRVTTLINAFAAAIP